MQLANYVVRGFTEKSIRRLTASLVHIHPAVDADRLAGHEITVVGSEEDHRADEIGGMLVAMKGAAL